MLDDSNLHRVLKNIILKSYVKFHHNGKKYKKKIKFPIFFFQKTFLANFSTLQEFERTLGFLILFRLLQKCCYIKIIFVSKFELLLLFRCVKSVQIRSFFWSVFSLIRTEYGEILRKPCRCFTNLF